eukprot:GEMP01065744.1.p1 GENE.GEMP01065744.1~~GEMP01065744.1.p1  ORF type:complete len:258 (+),score=46.50 GEMP01065744.1:129-902(+)
MGCPGAILATPIGIAIAGLALFVSQNTVDATSPRFIGSAIALLAPHVLYFIVWHHAAKFNKCFQPYSVTIFHYLALALKVAQIAAYGVWYEVQPIHEVIAIGAILLILGTTLNAIVYRKLGFVGVYYGFKLGHAVQWRTDFPFNILRHPQYIGSLLSFAGMACLVRHPAVENELVVLFMFQVIAYMSTSIMESVGDQDLLKKDVEDKKAVDEETDSESKAASPMKKKKSGEGVSPMKVSPTKVKRSATPTPKGSRLK